MMASLPSLDPRTTGPKNLTLSLRAASLACATRRQWISSKELPALQEHFGRWRMANVPVLQGHAFAEVGVKDLRHALACLRNDDGRGLPGASSAALARHEERNPRASDIAFYRSLLVETDDDVRRGLVAAEDATASQAEIARRLLASVASMPIGSAACIGATEAHWRRSGDCCGAAVYRAGGLS